MVAPPPVQLSTIGMWDSMFLMLLALVVFGPRRLPQIGRQIGKLMYEFRKASNDFKFQMEEELRVSEEADRRKKEEEERARQLALSPPAQTQTIDAQADIGAMEQASVSAQPPAVGLTSENPVESAASSDSSAAETENRIYPRINPPSTGETVAASRYGANGQVAEPAATQETATDAGVTAEANIGAEPAPSAGESPATGPSSDPNRTETVSQHG
ncbi:Sec-independent protein translocase subunit TatA/TatB [Occallatibacter riparius]|uniref:Twin-arginine translocase TatA/TatE family subunit n=1 Tax=Occallatibacter riparius TaxID=1002689 RepID=A0A9J7BGX3_9BACT|nr:twin-arginine translocase TatA/TatE family subunit [Occallatibacter riparius]UWZ81991.1 twin-arginine translocase TatA/TatE family subunit [Occallatibacter riparius]